MGLPPFILFFIKTFLLINLINYKLFLYGFIILIFSSLNSFYYLNIIRSFFIQIKKSNSFFAKLLSLNYNKNKVSISIFQYPQNIFYKDVYFE